MTNDNKTHGYIIHMKGKNVNFKYNFNFKLLIPIIVNNKSSSIKLQKKKKNALPIFCIKHVNTYRYKS